MNMDSTMKDLPPDVRSLLEAERGVVPPAPDGARERVGARVQASLGLAASVAVAAAVPAAQSASASAGAGSSGLPMATKWAALLLVGAVASTVIYLAARSPRQPAASPAAPSSVAPSVVVTPAPASPAPVAPAPAATAPVAPSEEPRAVTT